MLIPFLYLNLNLKNTISSISYFNHSWFAKKASYDDMMILVKKETLAKKLEFLFSLSTINEVTVVLLVVFGWLALPLCLSITE